MNYIYTELKAESASDNLFEMLLNFIENKRTQKRKHLPRLGRNARAIAREQILVPSNSLEVNSL